jgi:hypothetical protein
MNEDTVKIRVYVHIKFIGSEDSTVVEFGREYWEGMNDVERNDACFEALFELIDWGYDEVTR